MNYQTLHDSSLPISDNEDANDTENEDVSRVITHNVTENKGAWTHIEDLDTFFTRMYQYYLKGGFTAMVVSEFFQLFQYGFVVFFITFLIYCVNYPVLFKEDFTNPSVKANNVTIFDIPYPSCSERISFGWWVVLFILALVGLVKLIKSIFNLYHCYDIKMFYNKALNIKDCDIGWICWSTVLGRVRVAQNELQMCIQSAQITELDIYQRILRFNNYLIAMVNKKILLLHIKIPFVGEFPFLTKGLKYNLELLLFYGPWSPWENCWHLRNYYKDGSQRLILARKLENQIIILAIANLLLFPLILVYQILHFFFNYAELVKRSPGSLGLRAWSHYARISLRHYNELDHDLSERLRKAYKPSVRYLASFQSPITTTIARNITFLTASILGVVISLSIYDEVVLTVEHMLTLITILGCILAVSRSLLPEEGSPQGASEELLLEVLRHVHYLPSSWKGKAHTKEVATHFEQLFQFKGVYILMELFSPIVCPFILFGLRTRALDIVDFYRNFTISTSIGDVCSFAQMDIERHGNPDWPPTENYVHIKENVPQYYQAEDGKTELSLVAFHVKNPNWNVPFFSQRQYLAKHQNSLVNASQNYKTRSVNNNMDKSMLESFYDKHGGPESLGVDFRSAHNHNFIQEEDNEDDWIQSVVQLPSSINNANIRNEIIPDKLESSIQEESQMSMSTFHLYDLHNNRVDQQASRFLISALDSVHQYQTNETSSAHSKKFASSLNSERSPLLKK